MDVTVIMKRLLVLSILLFQTVWYTNAQSITAMTFNIRYDNPDDGSDNWHQRKQDMISFIDKLNPEILGIQEGLQHQVAYLDSNLESYEYVGVGRDDGKTKGEYCAIYYHTAQLKLLKSGTFWLSETPDEISVGWDASMERICTYGLFQNIPSGLDFWVFNTHFDHRGPEARKKSAQLILEQIIKMNHGSLPVILMGDFNAIPTDPPIKIIKEYLQDGSEISKQSSNGPTGTFNGFKGATENRRIDYIFTLGMTMESYKHLDARTKKDRNLSDHLPVIATVSIDDKH